MAKKKVSKRPSIGDIAFGNPFDAIKQERKRKDDEKAYQQKYRVKGTGRITNANHIRKDLL